MKIVLVSHFFPPTHTAGTEKRTFGYAKTLLERGHSVQVLCAGAWEEGERYWNGHTDEIYQGIPVRRIHLNWQKSPDPNRYLYDNPETARFFAHCLEEWQPDLVHITSCLTLSASIIPVAGQAGLPVVLTLTDFWFACPKLSLLKYDGSLCDGITTSRDCIRCLGWDAGGYQKLKKIISEPAATGLYDFVSKIPPISRQRGLRGVALDINQRKQFLSARLKEASAITAPSSHLRDTLQQSGLTNKIRVVLSGHDLSWLNDKQQKTPAERIRFGYIGQFIHTKGVHILLEAFGGHDWQNKAELRLFGNPAVDPGYWEELQKIPLQEKDRVHFHGPFPHEELGQVLAGLDVLIVPSLWHENNPRVIQEAFAARTPVIAANVGGISEFVKHDVNGLLYERDQVDDLAQQLKRLLSDPALISRLQASIKPPRTIADEVDELLLVYQEVLPPLHKEL